MTTLRLGRGPKAGPESYAFLVKYLLRLQDWASGYACVRKCFLKDGRLHQGRSTSFGDEGRKQDMKDISLFFLFFCCCSVFLKTARHTSTATKRERKTEGGNKIWKRVF